VANIFHSALHISGGKPADRRVDQMKTTPSKKTVAKAPPAKTPFTFQQLFDKWLLPVLFVAIGSVIVWAIWRH
jgi:hypothetical protein